MSASDLSVRLNVPAWADLPTHKDPRITDVFAAGLACIDETLPGASLGARDALGLEKGGEQLLFILVDGLGFLPLMENLGHAPTLRSFREEILSIHTIAPSTTAAAITAFGTGREPGATRMVGYSVAQGDHVMNLLAFEGGPDPEAWQECPSFFEGLKGVGVESVVISPHAFASSGLTRAALRGARHHGAMSWQERCDAALRELRAGTRVVYLYWSDVDHAGHAHGVDSWQWTEALELFDEGLGALFRRMPAGVCSILTADHGMVDIDHSQIRDLAEDGALAEGVRLIAGETRAVHVHAKPGSAEVVRRRWAEVLGESAWVLSPEEAGAVMGQGPGLAQIGDAVVFMGGRGGVVDSRTQPQRMREMPGVHGSLTSAEMRIPVLQVS